MIQTTEPCKILHFPFRGVASSNAYLPHISLTLEYYPKIQDRLLKLSATSTYKTKFDFTLYRHLEYLHLIANLPAQISFFDGVDFQDIDSGVVKIRPYKYIDIVREDRSSLNLLAVIDLSLLWQFLAKQFKQNSSATNLKFIVDQSEMPALDQKYGVSAELENMISFYSKPTRHSKYLVFSV